MKQCDSSTNLKRLEKSISKVVAEAKTAISKLEKAVSQAQQMVQELKKKTCVPRLNAFDVMRLSSQKKTTPKNPPKPTNSRPTQPTNRSKAIIAGQVVKQQKLNEQFLLSLASGGATSLQLPRINNDGQDQRHSQQTYCRPPIRDCQARSADRGERRWRDAGVAYPHPV